MPERQVTKTTIPSTLLVDQMPTAHLTAAGVFARRLFYSACAFIAGGMVGLAVGIATSDILAGLRAGVVVGLGAGGLILAGVTAMDVLEEVIQRDLNHDGRIGAPLPAEDVRIIPVRSGSVTTADTWAAFVMGCEVDTTERRWLPVIGLETYTHWRDMLIATGYGRWLSSDHRHGWALTMRADAILAAVHSPTLPDAVQNGA